MSQRVPYTDRHGSEERREHASRHFGARLRTVRQARGWTQEALAVRCGVTAVTISHWEQRPDPTSMAVGTLIALAQALHVSLGQLVGLECLELTARPLCGHDASTRRGMQV